MKQILILLLATVLMASCGNLESRSKKNKKNQADIEADKSEVTVDEKPKGITLSSFQGYTVGNGVRVRAEDKAKSAKVAELENGTLLTIIGETERRVLSNKTECERHGYPWFNVVTSDGHKGWIYGKYVYKLLKKGAKGVSGYVGATYKFNDEPYTFGVGQEQSMPISDNVGLTGCDDFMMPFFYKEGEGKITPIFVKNKEKAAYQLLSHSNNYWLLAEKEGRKDQVSRILPILYGVRVGFNVSFQEEGGTGEIDISQRNNRFYAQIKSYKKLENPQ